MGSEQQGKACVCVVGHACTRRGDGTDGEDVTTGWATKNVPPGPGFGELRKPGGRLGVVAR
jgi:hypothetical protein